MNRFQNCLAPRGRGNIRGYLFHCVRAMQIAAIAGLTSIALPNLAQAAVTGVLITTGTSVAPTGSAPFNGLPANIMPTADACTAGNNSTYTPGNDACGSDLIIRTNDDVTYNIQYVTSGADTVTITSVLPTNNGTPIADWKSLPPQCTGAGSGISADGQTLTCIISVSASATASILPQATVRGTTPNGTSFPIPATTVSGAGGGSFSANDQAGSTTAPLTVSAGALYDVAKRNSVQGGNQYNLAYVKGPDGTTDGWLFAFDVAVRVPYGSKGMEPLNTAGLTLQDVIGSITFSSADTAQAAAVQAAFQANAQLYNANGAWINALAGSAGGCWANGAGTVGNQLRDQLLPSGANSATTTISSIGSNNNGTCVATQAGVGAAINVSVTGANWTNTQFPTQSGDLQPLVQPYDDWVVADQIGVWVPASVFSGVPSGTNIAGNNALSSISATSISGQAIAQPTVADASGGGSVNDSVTFNFTQLRNFGLIKYFQDCGTSNNANCATLNIVGNHLRTGVAVPGQAFMAYVVFINTGTLPLDGAVACDKVDNTKNIVAINSATGTPLINVVDEATGVPFPASSYVIEYGYGGLNGAGASWSSNADYAIGTCAQDQSPAWFTSASSVPGGLSAITKVRVTFTAPILPQQRAVTQFLLQDTGTSTVAGFGSPAGTVWPVGTPINNWMTGTAPGVFAADGNTNVADSTGNVWTTGGVAGNGTGPYSASGIANYGLSDTITQATALARISKTTTTPDNSATQVIAGSTVSYVLSPSLSSQINGLPTTTIHVVDILPPSLNYVAGSASITPSSVQSNTPETGYTTLTWDLAGVAPNAAIAPISYDAIVDATAKNGVAIPNFTLISSPDDATACQASGGDYDQFLNSGYANNNVSGGGVTGTLCLRAARRDLLISAPPGFKTFKSVDNAVIEPNGSMTYTLSWVSNGTPPDTIDLIDVLPYVGDARTPATSGPNATRSLAAAPSAVTSAGDVSDDPAATFWYTSAAPGSINGDPQDPSNGTFGAPGGIWCSAVGGAGANCPASLAAVTAIRMVSGTPLGDSIARHFTYTLNTAGSATGNVYTNAFVTRGSGLTNVVTSNAVSTAVITGTLSGVVYADINNDGTQATSGEPGIDNVRVCLAGYSFGANGVDDGGSGDDILVAPICQQTSGGGKYAFVNILAGQYAVSKDNTPANSPGLAGYVDGKDTAGTLGGTVTSGSSSANDVISAIVMPIGATSSGYLFGELPVGTISVTKTVNGLPSATGWTFTLSSTTPGCTIAASTNNPATTPSGSNVSVSFANVPVYSTISTAPCQYSVAETAQSGYQLNASQSSALTGVTVTTGGTTALNVQNDQLYGSLQVTKNLSGGPLGTSGSFPITAACLFNGNTVTGITPSATQSVAATTGGSGQVTFANIPQGATCTVSEGAFPKAPLSYTYDAASITQPTAAVSATPITAVVNNHLTQQFGVLAATKSVSGSPAGYTDTFTLSASCSLSGTAVTGILPAASQTVTAGTGTTGTATFTNIPLGAICTVAEAAQPTANLPVSYSWIGPPSITQPAAAISAVPATALVVNTMQLQVAGLTVVKTVTGGPNGYGDSFPVSVACTFQNAAVTGITPSATQTVSATNTLSGSVNFDGIPLGAICTVTEGTLPAPPLSYQWATPTITQASAITAAGSTATVANALSQQFGSLVVSKTVTGGPAVYSDSFPITASCSLSGTDVSGGIVPSATQSVTAGTGSDGTLTFANIPQGSICTISEGALPTAPAGGYLWNTPQVTQPAAAISATPGTAGIANSMSLDPPFHLIKTVTGGPSTLNGSFTFNIDCGAVGKFTQTVVLSNALSGSVAISNLPAGSSCTFSEASVLPLAPNGFDWDALPPAQTKVIDGSDVTFINTLVASLPADPTLPDPIPALRDFTLAVLALLLLGVGARVLDQREVPRRRRKLDR